jgi:hypothetical protein
LQALVVTREGAVNAKRAGLRQRDLLIADLWGAKTRFACKFTVSGAQVKVLIPTRAL